MNKTRIEWCDRSWNVTTGCNGPNGVPCHYCYARKMAHRFRRSFTPTCHPERLGQPLALKKPARIFVDSAGDLFDPAIPDEFIDEVWEMMGRCQWHTFQVLTKQPKRMAEWFTRAWRTAEGVPILTRRVLRNVWTGVTAENQFAFDTRYPHLQRTPVVVRFVSFEPLLGPIDLRGYKPVRWNRWIAPSWDEVGPLSWVIIGNDSSPGAKLPDPAWVESLIEQCSAAEVPVFVKGKLFEQFPVQEYPHV